jgi:hypothetical protein
MHGQRTPAARSAQGDNSQLDKAGQTILQLLNKAADVAEQKSRHVIGTAQKLSHQIAQPGSDCTARRGAYCTSRAAERAGHWLNAVYVEIEDRF